MIKYTFKTIKNNSNNINYSYNNSEYELKSIIANNIANKYPWFGAPASNTYITTTYKKPLFLNFDTDYLKAINILDDYAAKKYNKKYLTFSDGIDEYDFEIDGTPVRIFDDMIQIGYHIIPRNMPKSYYINLSPEIKKTIINITIKIYK